MATIEKPTRDVFTQPPPLAGFNTFVENRPLVEAVRRDGAGWAEPSLVALGDEAGGEPLEWGRVANENPPILRAFDRYGNRIDEVEFHPAWHWLMELSIRHGTHALPWRDPGAGAHVARAAMMLASSGLQPG